MKTLEQQIQELQKELESIMLPSDILQGNMYGITKSEAEAARKEGRSFRQVLQPCLYFTYCGVDFDILVEDNTVMADEKTFSFPFNSPKEVVPIIKNFINRTEI